MLLDSEVAGSVCLFCWQGVRAEGCCKLTSSSLLAQIQQMCRCIEFAILAYSVNFKTQTSTCVPLSTCHFLLARFGFWIDLGACGLDSFQTKLKRKVRSGSSLGTLQALKGVHSTGPGQKQLEIYLFERYIVWKGVFSTNHFSIKSSSVNPSSFLTGTVGDSLGILGILKQKAAVKLHCSNTTDLLSRLLRMSLLFVC